MLDLSDFNLLPIQKKVFNIFSQICEIPHGSGNMKQIADYCENFAQNLGFKYIRDNADNIVIFKNGAKGYENSEPIILQGHLDMVCQHTIDRKIDFLREGLKIYREGDFIKAEGTTLGADNGIAIAYIMAILSQNDIAHPPIEAVFTTDEETGLIGANALNTSVLKGKKMINLDSETEDILTVSCAGGQDVIINLPYTTAKKNGTKLLITVAGLLGGHSGVEIDKCRTNANVLMGQILEHLNTKCKFDIISVNGGKKPNAIPDNCTVEICVNDTASAYSSINQFDISRIKENEPDFYVEMKEAQSGEYKCLDQKAKTNLIHLLKNIPNGVIKMSEEIEGLVETSLNLGILSTESNTVTFHYALRSNKESGLKDLTNQVINIAQIVNAKSETSGFYPPWEFRADSALRELYKKCFKEMFQKEIKVKAIHAGLECAVFAGTIKDLDCISVGPNMHDVHTPKETLSISSAVRTFDLLLKVLEESCKL